METKFCNKCKTDKDIEDFSWRNKSKGIKLSWCKECMRNACNKIYRESDTRKNRIQQLNKESVNKNIKFINTTHAYVISVPHTREHTPREILFLRLPRRPRAGSQ